jgi:hypothetical protein
MKLPTSRLTLIAAALLTGTCFEVPQIAPRRAQSTESPGRYWPHDADRLNQDANGQLEVRPA